MKGSGDDPSGVLARLARDRAWVPWVLLAPALAIFVAYRVAPLVWNLVLSLQHWSLFEPPRSAGLYHYEEMLLLDDTFRQSLVNTLVYMASAPFAIAIAFGIAMALDRPLRGRGAYRAAFFVSYPVMTVAVAVIWQWLLHEEVGLVNHVLLSAGLVDAPLAFLQDDRLALGSVIVASTWQVLGLYIIVLLTGLQDIPPSLHAAAATDGASAWQRFRHVTLPLMRPSVFLCVVIAIVNSFAAFDLVYVMTDGGPGHSSEMMITYIYDVAFTLARFDYAAALTIVNFVLFMALAWIANRSAGGNAGEVDGR